MTLRHEAFSRSPVYQSFALFSRLGNPGLTRSVMIRARKSLKCHAAAMFRRHTRQHAQVARILKVTALLR